MAIVRLISRVTQRYSLRFSRSDRQVDKRQARFRIHRSRTQCPSPWRRRPRGPCLTMNHSSHTALLPDSEMLPFSPDRASQAEPLLRSRSLRTPPVHAFRFAVDRGASPPFDDRNNNVPTPRLLLQQPFESPRPASAETESHRFLLRKYTGRPYARALTAVFWAALQAVFIAVAVLLVLGLLSLAQSLWLDLNFSFVQPTKGQFNWIYVTAGGGFLAGIFLLIPGAPSIGGYASLTQMLVHLETCPSESVPVMLSSCVSLACGAPLGPEVLLGVLASGLSTFLAQAVDLRTRALLLQTSLATCMGALIPSGAWIPLLLVHELIVTGRPEKVTVDSVIAEEVTEAEAEGQWTNLHVQSDSHDYLEGLTLQLMSTLIVAWLARIIAPSVIPLDEFTPLANRDSEPWHLAVAALIGILCGLVGILILIMYSTVCCIRRKTSKGLKRRGIPQSLTLIGFTTLAGAIHGLLAVWCPYSATSGLDFLQASWEAKQNQESILNAKSFCFTAIARSIGLAVTLGCGFIGGTVIPMLVIGACIGFSLSLWISWLPVALAVPCCLAACPVSLCPIPGELSYVSGFVLCRMLSDD